MSTQLPTHHHHHHHHPQRRAVDLRIPAIEKYAYCLCLHVKPTTIFIAVFKLIRALLFASMLLNAEFSNEQLGELNLTTLDERHRSATIAVSILTRIIMASVAAVAIYAVISGRAALLMPLYAMLLVDFFFSLPAFYNRELDHPSVSDNMPDFKLNYSNTGNNNNQYTRYSIMLFATISVIVKIYFLCVIWKCYRYLRLIELVSPIRIPDNLIYPHIHPSNGMGSSQYPIVRILSGVDPTDSTSGHNVAPPPYDSIASNMKPPNYEEAMKTSDTILGFSQSNPTYHHQQLQQHQQQTTVCTTDLNSDHRQQQHQNVAIHVASNGNIITNQDDVALAHPDMAQHISTTHCAGSTDNPSTTNVVSTEMNDCSANTNDVTPPPPSPPPHNPPIECPATIPQSQSK